MKYGLLIIGIILIGLGIFIGYRLKKIQKQESTENMVFYGAERTYLNPGSIMLYTPGIIFIYFAISRYWNKD